MPHGPSEVLLVDDDHSDVELILEVLGEANAALSLPVVHDGVAAMAYLRCQGAYAQAVTPDLVLLDLNMPKKSVPYWGRRAIFSSTRF